MYKGLRALQILTTRDGLSMIKCLVQGHMLEWYCVLARPLIFNAEKYESNRNFNPEKHPDMTVNGARGFITL